MLSDDEAMQRASPPIIDEAHCSNDVNANGLMIDAAALFRSARIHA
jgi:hypothetical protein